MSSPEGARATRVRRFVDQVWNGRDYEAAADLFAPRYTNAFGTGPEARAEAVRLYHRAFPDLRVEVDELIEAADTVVLRGRLRGTDTGGYAGRPPTGAVTEEWFVSIMHFEGDLVAREWVGADKLGLFIGLGVVEDPWPN